MKRLLLLALVACTEAPVVETEALGDDYEALVHVPAEYEADATRRFSVVYQLDPRFAGLRQFDRTVAIATRLAAERRIPPVIVVGIGYKSDQNLRFRDYTFPVADPDPLTAELYGHGAEAFSTFVKDVLIPYVDSKYRTNVAAPRTLIGHSLGGLYALYSLTRADNPFSRIIAASASYQFENGDIFAQEAAMFARTQQAPVRLFTSMGEVEGAPVHVYFDEFSKRLRSRQYVGFELNDQSIASADHLDTIEPSVELGLTWLLGDAP